MRSAHDNHRDHHTANARAAPSWPPGTALAPRRQPRIRCRRTWPSSWPKACELRTHGTREYDRIAAARSRDAPPHAPLTSGVATQVVRGEADLANDKLLGRWWGGMGSTGELGTNNTGSSSRPNTHSGGASECAVACARPSASAAVWSCLHCPSQGTTTCRSCGPGLHARRGVGAAWCAHVTSVPVRRARPQIGPITAALPAQRAPHKQWHGGVALYSR